MKAPGDDHAADMEDGGRSTGDNSISDERTTEAPAVESGVDVQSSQDSLMRMDEFQYFNEGQTTIIDVDLNSADPQVYYSSGPPSIEDAGGTVVNGAAEGDGEGAPSGSIEPATGDHQEGGGSQSLDATESKVVDPATGSEESVPQVQGDAPEIDPGGYDQSSETKNDHQNGDHQTDLTERTGQSDQTDHSNSTPPDDHHPSEQDHTDDPF